MTKRRLPKRLTDTHRAERRAAKVAQPVPGDIHGFLTCALGAILAVKRLRLVAYGADNPPVYKRDERSCYEQLVNPPKAVDPVAAARRRLDEAAKIAVKATEAVRIAKQAYFAALAMPANDEPIGPETGTKTRDALKRRVDAAEKTLARLSRDCAKVERQLDDALAEYQGREQPKGAWNATAMQAQRVREV